MRIAGHEDSRICQASRLAQHLASQIFWQQVEAYIPMAGISGSKARWIFGEMIFWGILARFLAV